MENYYEPLRTAFPSFLEHHEHHKDAYAIVESEECEMRLYETSGQWYGYAFYIARRPAASDEERDN